MRTWTNPGKSTTGCANSAFCRVPPILTWFPSRSTLRPQRAWATPRRRCCALFAGAEHIERVDCLVQRLAREHGLQSDTLEEIVALVDERLARNRLSGTGKAPTTE